MATTTQVDPGETSPRAAVRRKAGLRGAAFAVAAGVALPCAAGCDDGYASWLGGAYASVTAEDVTWTAAPDGGMVLEATVIVHLESDEPDQVALDAVGLHADGVALEVDEVIVDASEWPVDLGEYDVAERRMRVRARAPATPAFLDGPCMQPLSFEARVDLLVRAGTTEGWGTWWGEVPSGPARIGVRRDATDVDASGRDAYAARPSVTIDGAGTVWVLDRDEWSTWTALWARTPDGTVTRADLEGAGSIAPAPDGVYVVSPRAGEASVSLRRRVDEVAWTVRVRSSAIVAEVPLAVAAHPDRVVVAVPGGHELRVEGRPVEPPDAGTFLIAIDPAGAVLGVDRPPVGGVLQLAVTESSTFVVSLDQGLVSVERDVVRWSLPLVVDALATDGEDVVVAGEQAVARYDADGLVRWSTPLPTMWPTSIAVREGGEILVGSWYGAGARIAPGGAPIAQAQVVCDGALAFGGSGGRVGFAAIFMGIEGWGDVPDRTSPTPLVSLGEVLP